MIIRKAMIEDVSKIIKIIDQAKLSLREDGVDQWQDGYPNQEIILQDIQDQVAYVVVDQKNICASFMLKEGPDPTYSEIHEGSWLKQTDTYYVLHRLTVDKNHQKKGIAKFIMNYILTEVLQDNHDSLRIDTHPDNFRMQSLLLKLNFQRCGVIRLESGALRDAFEIEKEL